MNHFSQYSQDSLIGDVLFKGKRGFFVDVGARCGVENSNTHYLEKVLGWEGIALEPHPDLFKRLISRRSCHSLNLAASDSEGILEFVKFLEEPLGNSGLVSTFRGPERLANIKHEIITVSCKPLSQVLNGVKTIDYLDIDVEGHELEVLRGMNWDIDIKIIGVETANKAKEIDAYLDSKGFRPFIQLVSDRFYAKGVPSA